MNLLLSQIRSGISDPLVIVAQVTEIVRLALLRAVRERRQDADKWQRYLNALTRYPEEAGDLASYYIEYEDLPRAEREQIKRCVRAEHFQRAAMARQASTPIQVATLRQAGVPMSDSPIDNTASPSIDAQRGGSRL